MCNYIVTKEEVEKAEQDVFGNGLHFNDEQKTFLNCLASCCVQAYAGTGKTSTIVGKLHTLAQKNVWQNGRGVCVISHTNVAVDEIKKHVAKHYPAIMQYPNFIGTIQEFVNKFLFIPYLASKKLYIKFQDEYRYLQLDSFPIVKDRIRKYRNSINRNNNRNKDAQLKRFNEAIRSCFLYEQGICVATDDKESIPLLEVFPKLPTKDCDKTLIVNAFQNCIIERRSAGSFLYDESFIDGYGYLKQNPILKNIISQRFQFAFLDEAQDCSEIQLKILNELFSDSPNTVFQQIGDINQAISETQWVPENYLTLNRSTRFGNNIAGFINKFQVSNGSGVSGTSEETKKYLITYNSGKEKDVLQKFTEILKSEDISADKCYFAISHKHDQIKNYFPDYSEKIAKNRNKNISYRFETDIEYLDLINEDTIRRNGSHFVSSILFSLLYKHYKEGGNSWSELKELLRNGDKADDFRKLVVGICNDVLLNKHISDFDKLKNDLNGISGKNVIDFTRSGDDSDSLSNSATISDNIYANPDKTIKIKIGTIHSVKGQTHDATLLFSNHEYKKQDIQHALGSTPQQTPDYKRLLYVAASRPKYLFAFAIEKNAYNGLTDGSCFDDFEKVTI